VNATAAAAAAFSNTNEYLVGVRGNYKSHATCEARLAQSGNNILRHTQLIIYTHISLFYHGKKKTACTDKTIGIIIGCLGLYPRWILSCGLYSGGGGGNN